MSPKSDRRAGGAHVQDITSMKKHLEREGEGEEADRPRPGAAFCRSTAGSTEKNEWITMPFMPLLTCAFVKICAKSYANSYVELPIMLDWSEEKQNK